MEVMLSFLRFGMEEQLLNTVAGTRDILPAEMPGWHLIEDRARKLFSQYGFLEIRTPLLEPTELFARGIGGETDIVGKEMYTFFDQSGRSVTLRPEATASVVRAYVQHAMYRAGGMTKLYYLGPMFRHEKKQKGRWRQFYQVGAEVIGSGHPAVEAEVIELVMGLLTSLGVNVRLKINSVGDRNCRPAYMGLLRQEISKYLPQLCPDCRRRAETNPLRVLDCKIDSCQAYIGKLPSIADHLCGDCSDHFHRVQGYLQDAGISYEVVPRLVRGLDYYVRTAFEIVSGELGSQNALAGGGRYDGLSEVLGGPPTEAFGFALGLDRMAMLLSQEASGEWIWQPEIVVVHLGAAAFHRALDITRELRRQGWACYMEFSGGSLKSQMRLANRINAHHVLIIGENELSQGRYPVKRLADSQQWEVSLDELISYLKSRNPAVLP
jgi:histidyl-tRNA synthetase